MSKIKRLRLLLAKTAPPPWTALIDDYMTGSMFATNDPAEEQSELLIGDGPEVELAVAAVNALPALLEAAEALDEVVRLIRQPPGRAWGHVNQAFEVGSAALEKIGLV